MLNNYKGNNAYLKMLEQEKADRFSEKVGEVVLFLGMLATAGASITLLNWIILGVFE